MSEVGRQREAVETAKLPVSSSFPPQFAPEQEELYRNVLTVMNDCRVPYVVSGAFALHEHTGIWRDTKDLDLFLCAHHMPSALRCLERGGYQLEVRDPVWLAKAWKDEYFVDLITGMSNAVIRVDETWIDRGQPSKVLDVPTRILRAEEFIASKIFVTRRERFDGADVAHVIYATRDHLDWQRLFTLVGDHWEMLLWSLIFFRYVYPRHANEVPREVLHELMSRFERDLSDPKLDAPFRGSLIDENMFAIDVKEWGLENEIEKYRSKHRHEHSHLHEKPAA
jgi:hypothetical protein